MANTEKVTSAPSSSVSKLKARALRGGAYIMIRQGLGMVLSLIGVLCVTRVIGPMEYGFFAATYGLVAFVANVATWGIDVYLIRKPNAIGAREYNLAFTLLLAISSCCVALFLIGRNIIPKAIHIPEASQLLLALAFYLPTSLLTLPGVVQLDRELRYKRVAYNELASQILNYVVAVPLAFNGAGAWAPTFGILTQQVSLLAFTYFATSFRPRLVWDSGLVRDMLGYGFSYSSSIWVWQLRTLINPVIVGRLAGATAVGNVALAIRMTEVLCFAKGATWRVAMAALAKLGESRERLRKSIEEGMRLQAIAVGMPLAAFSFVARFILPTVFGHRWDSALVVFPFIALDYLCNSMFNLHASVLYLLRRNLEVTWFHVVHVAIFSLSSSILVPSFGVIGYGLSAVMAIGAYAVIHGMVVNAVGRPRYGSAAIWSFIAAANVIASTSSSSWRISAALLFVIPILLPRERSHITGYARLLLAGESA